MYRQYLKWKIITLKLGVGKGNLGYYEKLLREHQIRWAPFQE